MDTEGSYDARGTRADGVPRPAGPPPLPPRPPLPPHVPGAGPSLGEWLRIPRPEAALGTWRYGHRPRPAEEPDRVAGRSLVSGALISFLAMVLLWSLYDNQYFPYWLDPLYWAGALVKLTDDAVLKGIIARTVEVALIVGGIVFFARLGRWAEVARRYLLPIVGVRRPSGIRPVAAVPAGSPADPAQWPELRGAGQTALADRLAQEAGSGRMNDVDHSRIRRAWQSVQADPSRLTAFTEGVLNQGAAAFTHPSRVRDLPVRAARHDLLLQQVRIGTADGGVRNPYPRRTTGVALDPALLGTSLLAVGPSGSGKSARLVRPVVESMCLLALANRAAVVAVTAHGAGLAPDDAFDLVIAVGRPGATHDLDLYGGTEDPDESARTLAEALVGDLTAGLPGGDSGRAATAIAQLIGPFHAVHGRFPSVPELRELLGGAPAAHTALRDALTARGGPGDAAQLRELDARQRQAARADDIGVLLAERIAFLDRPAFAGFFRTDGGGRRFSLRAIEHPLRVRVDLPERGHAEASRIIARLLLAQFTEAALHRADRSLFAALVLDDATRTVTADSVGAVQRLRSANAGVVLALRTLEDVPEPLRGPLLGAVGCRMAFSGLAPWDGNRFAETWGTEWVQTRDVTNRQIISDEPLTKAMHMMRRLVTGKAATAEAITVREVERARWSASDLAHSVPAGHAVLSLTSVSGEHAPPLLVDLRS
ncbi:ATP-binding protein [Streptomyces sp. CAU 1734]|uniref:ATP-binding protein n=1 Tax=Streptomyces sp. CAU 1734 TaxID=3140360 RepID=UPI0032615A0F